MAYFIPYCDDSGFHIPTYQDILDSLIEGAQSVYGVDVYLGIDSTDYQFLSIIALKLFDSLQAVQLAWNNTSPTTAVGSGLSSIVKLNGIARKAATYSECTVELTGTRATTINNGVVQDENGVKWNLPVIVTLQAAGSPLGEYYYLSCTAKAQDVGAITALPNTITSIVTPTYGWTRVNNSTAATVGTAVETDAQLRVRQALSVSMPSITKLDGTISAIAALDNVTRYRVYENYSHVANTYGVAHSITAIVEGGDNTEIATAIYNNRGIGCAMNGAITIPITSTVTGLVTNIQFSRPDYVPIYTKIYVYPLIDQITGDTLYTTADTDAIEAAVLAYLNSLQIGDDLTISGLYGAALSIMDDLSTPIFSIKNLTAGIDASPQATTDITVAFDHVVSGEATNIQVIIVGNNGSPV